jgi:tetratricopeptide (TPR) repeat protein
MSLAKAGEDQEALDLAKNLSEVDQADVWMSIAEKKIKDNKKKDGMEWLDKAFTVLKEADVPRDPYSKLISIARQYSLVPDPKKTSIVMSQILQLMSRQIEFSNLEGRGRNEYLLTALEYIEFGEFEDALRISKKMVVSGETAVIKIKIAREYIKAGDKEKALPLLSKALEEIQSLEAYSTGYYKSSLLASNAAAYKKAGETGKAFVIFQQSSSAVKKLEDPSDRASAFISIAREYEALNMREESIANLKNAVSSISEIQHIQARAYPLAEVALMIYQIGSKPDQKNKDILHEIVSAISK